MYTVLLSAFKDTLKKINDKIGEFWWAILLAAVVLVIILFIVISHKNRRIHKLKREIKRLHAQIEIAQDEVAAQKKEVAAQKKVAAAATAAADAAAAYAATAIDDDTQTEEYDDPDTSSSFDDEVERAASRVAYYNKTSVVSQKEGNVKFTVKYDRPKDSWVIKKEGSDRVVRRLDTKEEAVAVARTLCKRFNANLVVHKKDGKFQKQ